MHSLDAFSRVVTMIICDQRTWNLIQYVDLIRTKLSVKVFLSFCPDPLTLKKAGSTKCRGGRGACRASEHVYEFETANKL